MRHPAPVAPLLLFALLCNGSCTARAPAPSASRPNILWISAEDLSPDLGCYGDASAITPNLDRLATQGARFDRAFATAPVCAPSRSAIITGLYAASIGTHHMRSDVTPPAYVRCFTEHLRAAGYYCTNNAKTDYNFPAPLTAWDRNGRDGHWKHRAPGQPFFAVFNLNETHESRVFNLDGKFDRITDELSPQERHDPSTLPLPPYYPDTPVVRANWARWYDLVTLMDKRVGSLLDELEEEGLAENTIVIFWGDHGRGLPRGKRFVYDSGLRVPLIVRWPGKIAPGTARDDLVSLVDLAPTMLALAGVRPPENMQGRVFLGPGTQPPPPTLLATRDRMDERYDMMRSARGPRFHYIRNFQPGKPYAHPIAYMDRSSILKEWRRLAAEGKLDGPPALFFSPTKPAEELYDTQLDPHEVNNLASSPEHQEVLRTLRRELVEWMERIDDKGVFPEPVGSPATRPNRPREVTAAPLANVRGRRVELMRLTPGSSIAYTFESGPDAAWKLYVGPVEIPSDRTLRARACRIGFADSPQISVSLDPSE